MHVRKFGSDLQRVANRKLLVLDAAEHIKTHIAIAHEPIHPGEILLEEFLNPMGITQYRLAQAISVPARRINEIVHGKRSISPDTALRLSRALGTSDRFWMNLQSRYDLDVAVAAHHDEFDQIKPLVSA